MCTGAASIDDRDMLRAGGMPILFDGIYAPSTFGTLLPEFSFGHARQLESVLRQHLIALTERTELLVGIDDQVFVDIDSLLRPVYGHTKQGASHGHTKIVGKQVLRKGLSPLAATISTAHAVPLIAGMRRRAGKTGSGKGAGRMIAQAIATARAAGATGKILVRGDSAYGSRVVVRACVRGKAVLPGDDQEPGHSTGHRRHPRHRLDPRCVTQARCTIPTQGRGSPTPKSLKCPTPRCGTTSPSCVAPRRRSRGSTRPVTTTTSRRDREVQLLSSAASRRKPLDRRRRPTGRSAGAVAGRTDRRRTRVLPRGDAGIRRRGPRG
jgi:hypothetical protein